MVHFRKDGSSPADCCGSGFGSGTKSVATVGVPVFRTSAGVGLSLVTTRHSFTAYPFAAPTALPTATMSPVPAATTRVQRFMWLAHLTLAGRRASGRSQGAIPASTSACWASERVR